MAQHFYPYVFTQEKLKYMFRERLVKKKSLIHNSQKLETTQISLNIMMGKV